MTSQERQGIKTNDRTADLTAGLSIGLGSVLSVALMAHHPSISAGETAEFIAKMTQLAALAGFVHGGLIVMMFFVLFGFVGFAGRLGWHLARVRAGMMAYAIGALSMMGAALVNGFMVPALARSYAGKPVGEMEIFGHLLRLCHEANQALAGTGVVAMSIAAMSWSLVMVGEAGSARVIGGLGLAMGSLAVVGLLSGHLHLNLHGMGAVVVAQAVWSVGVAAWLLRPVSSPSS